MRKILQYSSAAYLVLLMLTRMMGMPIAVLDYSLHRDFIAAGLCENKARPEINCAGKCYLKKQLSRSNESSESQEQKGTAKNFTVDFFEQTEPFHFDNGSAQLAHFPAFPITRLNTPFVAGIFHPPLSAAA